MIIAPVPRKSLGDSLYEQLRDAIVDGTIAPGDALPSERELAEQFGLRFAPGTRFPCPALAWPT